MIASPIPVPGLSPGEVIEVWQADLGRISPSEPVLRGLLSEEEVRQADRFRFAADRRRFVLRRAFRRQLLGARLGLPPRDLRFSAGPAGKPALADNSAGLHFNGSASGDIALLAVTGLGEVGCDVQLHSPLDPGLAQVIERFSPVEQAALARLEPGLRATAFFDCWTRKEAFVKALGCGLSLPLHEFTVSLEPGVPAALLHWDHDPDPSPRWTLTALPMGPGYSAALAVHRPCEAVLRHWVWPD